MGGDTEEMMSNVLAVATEVLQQGGLIDTNLPPGGDATNTTFVLPQAPVGQSGSVRPGNQSRKEGRPQSGDRESRRRSYRQSYDSVRSRDTFPGNRSGAETGRTNAAPVRRDYAAFSIVADRNIFNPNRTKGRVNEGPVKKAPVIESLSLVGTMSYEKGTFAFFDGSSSSFRKALKAADSIAGYKLTEIGVNSVRLSSGTNVLELRVGSQLRREDEGEWTLTSQPVSYTASTSSSSPSSSSSSSASTSSGADGDVLKRMMQRREQE
jgi:hypothetical protein